jgi:hypothetical protein
MTRKGDRKSGICGVRYCGILQYAVPENPLQLAKIMQGSPSLLKSLSACRERARERERREEREREKERERERERWVTVMRSQWRGGADDLFCSAGVYRT